MVRLLLTKYWVLAHLLVTAGTLCFVPRLSVGLGLWLASSLLLMVLCLPPVLKGESFWMARVRVGQALRKDVVAWAGLLGVLYVGLQLFNGPRVLAYASELRRWVFSPPPMPFFPSSIERGAGETFLVGLLGALACALAVRCALPRKQRLFALIGLGLLTGLVAVGGVGVACVTGETPSFAWFGGGYDVSVLWLLMLCVCFGVAGEAFLEGRVGTFVVALAAACVNELGLFAAGHAALLGVSVPVVVIWLAFSVFAVRASGRFPRLLWHCAMLLPPLFVAGIGLALVPGAEAVRAGLGTSEWSRAMETFASQWSFRAGLSLQVLGMNPMLGVGPEGFGEMARFYLKGRLDWSLWKTGGTALPCDFLRLLTERGMVGGLLLLLPGAAMLGRCLMRWVEFRQDTRHHYSLRYVFVLAGSLLGVLCVLLASLVGTPLHTPAVLCVFLTVCACMGGWMPRAR